MAKRDDEIGEDDKGDEEDDDDDEEEDEDEEEGAIGGALCVELFFPPTFKFNSDC